MVWPILTLLMADMVFCVADMVVADVVRGRYRRFPFSSVVSRCRGMSTCVKAALHIVNIDFEFNYQ